MEAKREGYQWGGALWWVWSVTPMSGLVMLRLMGVPVSQFTLLAHFKGAKPGEQTMLIQIQRLNSLLLQTFMSLWYDEFLIQIKLCSQAILSLLYLEKHSIPLF